MINHYTVTSTSVHIQVQLRHLVTLYVFGTCLCLCAQTLKPLLTPEDLGVASYAFQNDINVGLDVKNSTLEDAPKNPDGSRGYSVIQDFEVGTTKFSDNDEKNTLIRLREEICDSQAIVIARAGKGEAYLVHNNQGIVTARKFWVTRSLYGTVNVGDTVTAVEFGGTIQQANTTLRVEISGTKPFIPGQNYLLFLSKVPMHPSHTYFLSDSTHARVANNRIYSPRRAGDDIIPTSRTPGQTVESMAAKLTKAQSELTCQHTPN